MKATRMVLFTAAVLLTAGCKTTEETKPLTWKEQSAYMAKVKDPRQFGYSIYQTPSGIEYRGGSRLHPNQTKILEMEVKDPLRPVVMLRGKLGLEAPILLDFTLATSWMEFDLAESMGAVPISEGKAQLVKIPGEEIPGCLSAVSTIRVGQVFMENPMVYVRMANGPLGSLARGVESPAIKGVIGWDLLKKFEQVYLDYAEKRMVITTAKIAYEPNPAMVVGRIPLVKHAGACAVRGTVDGRNSLILIDPAGDFEIAGEASNIQLAPNLVFSSSEPALSPGGIRIGARLLQNYNITICPQAGVIYFEKLPVKK